MPPTFSVVIPTYNQADFLKVALASVLAQTYDDFELIVVNNYSSDHTLDVLAEVTDARLSVINFRNDGIIAASRNTGIKASKGAYVAFLDSDDAWNSNKLERVAQAIADFPQAGLYSHGEVMVRGGKITARESDCTCIYFTVILLPFYFTVILQPVTSIYFTVILQPLRIYFTVICLAIFYAYLFSVDFATLYVHLFYG